MVRTSPVGGEAHWSVSQSSAVPLVANAPLIQPYGISIFNDVCDQRSKKLTTYCDQNSTQKTVSTQKATLLTNKVFSIYLILRGFLKVFDKNITFGLKEVFWAFWKNKLCNFHEVWSLAAWPYFLLLSQWYWHLSPISMLYSTGYVILLLSVDEIIHNIRIQLYTIMS